MLNSRHGVIRVTRLLMAMAILTSLGGCVVSSERSRPDAVQQVLRENRVHYDLSDPIGSPLTRDEVGFDPGRQFVSIDHLGGRTFIDVTVSLPTDQTLEVSVSHIAFRASSVDPDAQIDPHSLDLSRSYDTVEEAYAELVAFEEQFGLDTSTRPSLSSWRSGAAQRIADYQSGASSMSYLTYVWYTPQISDDLVLGVEAAVYASTGRVGLRYMLRWPPSQVFDDMSSKPLDPGRSRLTGDTIDE